MDPERPEPDGSKDPRLRRQGDGLAPERPDGIEDPEGIVRMGFGLTLDRIRYPLMVLPTQCDSAHRGFVADAL
jgi:hypothetical protein